MNIRSHLLEEQNLIVVVFNEPVSLEGMISSRKVEISNGWIQKGRNTLVVSFTQDIDLSPIDLSAYGKWASENLKELEGSKSAIIVNSPIATALAEILGEELTDIRTVKTFSTLKPAAAWLGTPAEAIIEAVPEIAQFDLR